VSRDVRSALSLVYASASVTRSLFPRKFDKPANRKSVQHSRLCFGQCNTKQEAQLLLEKADRTTYVRRPASDFQSLRESDFSEMTQFHARYVNDASITDVARGHLATWYK